MTVLFFKTLRGYRKPVYFFGAGTMRHQKRDIFRARKAVVSWKRKNPGLNFRMQ